MLPTVQTGDLAIRGLHGGGQAVGLAVTKISSFDVGWLDLAAMMDDGSSAVDEGLIWVSNVIVQLMPHVVAVLTWAM